MAGTATRIQRLIDMRILGCDLGQASDPSAAAVVDRVANAAAIDPDNQLPQRGFKLLCRGLKRYPLGVDYCDVCESVLSVPSDVLVVDFTGVGRPVVDLLRRMAMGDRLGKPRAEPYRGKIVPVIFAASNVVLRGKTEARGRHYVVPKVDIVSSTMIAQQQKLLSLPSGPLVESLLREMADFRIRYTASANVTMGNAPGKHDDLLIALCLACWYALRFARSLPSLYVPPTEIGGWNKSTLPIQDMSAAGTVGRSRFATVNWGCLGV